MGRVTAGIGLRHNRVSGDRHRHGIVAAMRATGLPVLGSILRTPDIALPKRHLGLVQASEHAAPDALMQCLAELAERYLDVDAITAMAVPLVADGPVAPALPPPGQRIALAYDPAFGFAYPHLLDGWRAAGAELLPFSPLADEPPDECSDVCWLPGGYPELRAARLANATTFRTGVIRFARTRPVHGECGGYMVLGQGIEDADGTHHAMFGLLGHGTGLARRRLHLGYRRATLLADGVLGSAGGVLRGQEFLYATLTEPGGDPPMAHLTNAIGRDLGPAGGRRGLVSGRFFHVVAMETDA